MRLWPFGRRGETKPKHSMERVISIQASVPEGSSRRVMLESLLTGLAISDTVPGTVNAYTTYESQVSECYNKYNGQASFGSQQLRAVVDLRVAFIAGEGIGISAKNEQTSAWIEQFILRNLLDGPSFVQAVKGSELAGQSLFVLKPATWVDGAAYIKATRVPYQTARPYKPVWADERVRDEVVDVMVKKERGADWQRAGFSNFVYVRTGGDDGNFDGPSTKVGVVLTDFENYDRAIKDMRRNNHVFARITPVWETGSDGETTSLRGSLNDLKWKIGSAFIGKAKFHYETPQEGAHQNLATELASTIKTISSVTGVPVHWLGYVDLMSNRATAESLYEFIKNATINERVVWQSAIFEMISKAQRAYVDAGGTELDKIDYDFEVKLPLIDFANFLDRVRGLSLAYADEAISIDDYRGNLPGIDPLKTERMIASKKAEDETSLKSNLPPLIDATQGDGGAT